jgi:hypothetical protein
MANVKNGRMFSAEFNKATEVNGQTRLLAQTPNEPVEYVDLEQVAEVVNEGMLSEQEAVANYATKTGEYKELTAGFAYEILGDGQATSEEFSFRPTGGPNRNVRDGSARIELLKGNSVVWNQLVDTDTTSVTLTAKHKYITNIGGTISLQSPTSATTINVEGGVDKVTDLTKMFGAGNEPTTVEQFYELLPEGVDINAYNKGEKVDANYKSIKSTGFNQFNGTYAKVLGGVKYYLGGTYTSIGYTTEKGGTTEAITLPTSTEIVGTTPSDRLYTPSQNGYIYAQGTDICINIAWDEYSALNGQYKPYNPFYRYLGWVSKYFPNGMRSAGNVADEIRFNATTQQWEAVQRVGIVDLGSLTWGYGTPTGSYELFYTSANSIENALYYGGGVLPNAISELYMPVTANLLSANGENNTFTLFDGNKRMMVRNTSYTDAETFKAAMDGVMLNYELATPIVTPITEDVNLAYDVADYGTEQLIVADGAQSAPLSAEVVYEPNVLASIKQVATMLTRLDALETAVATMQASAVATTNEE